MTPPDLTPEQKPTHCSACGRKLIKRARWGTWRNHLGKCPRYAHAPDVRKEARRA